MDKVECSNSADSATVQLESVIGNQQWNRSNTLPAIHTEILVDRSWNLRLCR